MKGNEKLPAGQPGGRPLPGEGAFGLPAGHPGCRVPGVSTPGAGYANTERNTGSTRLAGVGFEKRRTVGIGGHIKEDL